MYIITGKIHKLKRYKNKLTNINMRYNAHTLNFVHKT